MTVAVCNGSALRRRILVWHRRVGLAVSAMLLFVVVTGIALNHVAGLGLDRKVVANDAVLDWYGMKPKARPVSYRVGEDWLTWVGSSLYLNERQLDETVDAVTGAVAFDAFIVVAAPQALFVFTKDGSLVEKLSGAGIPGAIEAIGLGDSNHLILRTPEGAFSADGEFLDWMASAAPLHWVRPAPLSSELETAILSSYRGAGLPWSRLLLDIHTGRIFGAFGPYLVDLTALALLLLSGTGIYNWVRRER